MMILAELLRDSIEWRNAQIYLKLVVPDRSAAETAKHNIDDLVQKLRIDAEIFVLVAEGRPFDQILHESSHGADLVMLGIAEPDDNFQDYYSTIEARIRDLPSTMLVLAAPNFAFAEVLKK